MVYVPKPFSSTFCCVIDIALGISFSTLVTDNSPSPTLVTLICYELNSLPRFIVPGEIALILTL